MPAYLPVDEHGNLGQAGRELLRVWAQAVPEPELGRFDREPQFFAELDRALRPLFGERDPGWRPQTAWKFMAQPAPSAPWASLVVQASPVRSVQRGTRVTRVNPESGVPRASRRVRNSGVGERRRTAGSFRAVRRQRHHARHRLTELTRMTERDFATGARSDVVGTGDYLTAMLVGPAPALAVLPLRIEAAQ